MKTIRVSEENDEWFQNKKEEYFNTTEVSYRVLIDKLMEEDSE